MLTADIIKDEALIILEPVGPLEETDFEQLSAQVDAYTQEHGPLKGMIIKARKFPGWKNFNAFKTHMRFIKSHHQKVKKVAAVTDSRILSAAPHIAGPFVSSEIRRFKYDNLAAAKSWISDTT